MNSIIRRLFGSPSTDLSRRSSQTSINSSSSTRSNWSFLSLFIGRPKQTEEKTLSAKVIEEVFVPLERTEAELRTMNASKTTSSTTQRKITDLSKSYFKLKTKAYELSKVNKNLSTYSPTLVRAYKIKKILEDHPNINRFLKNEISNLNQKDSEALQELYSLCHDHLLREYLGYETTEPSSSLKQYQGILDELLGSNKSDLNKLYEKLFTQEITTSTSIDRSFIVTQRTSFSRLLLELVSMNEKNDFLLNQQTRLQTKQTQIANQIGKLKLIPQKNESQNQELKNLETDNANIASELAEIAIKLESLKKAIGLS